MYSMVLKDINRTRLNNSVISPADVDFIVQQSALASFGKAGLIKDKNIQGFLLRKINIPSNVELQEKYNAILKRLNKETDGLVQILDDHYHLVNESSAVELAQRLDEMYIGRDKSEENIVLQELFDAMTNTKLDSVKSKMLEYITSFGDEGQLQLLSMLKFQGIIKRNVDNKLELIEEDKLIQKFEESDLIERTLEKRGFREEFVQNQIEKRKELHRLYIGDSSDTVKNPSLNLDGFFKKYNLIYLGEDGNNEYVNHENEDSLVKKTIFENEIFDEAGAAERVESLKKNVKFAKPAAQEARTELEKAREDKRAAKKNIKLYSKIIARLTPKELKAKEAAEATFGGVFVFGEITDDEKVMLDNARKALPRAESALNAINRRIARLEAE